MLKSGKIVLILGMMFICLVLLFNGVSAGEEEPEKEPVKEKSGSLLTEKEIIDSLPKTKRSVSGVVVDMLSGEVIADAQVSLLKETVKTDASGKFLINDVDEFHAIQMTARITTDLDIIIGCSYFFVPTSYYPISAVKDNKVDVQIINMVEDVSNVVLKVAEYNNNTVDKYCEKCHEVSPCLVTTDYGQIADEKKKLRGMMVRQSELEEYIDEMRKKKMDVQRYSSIRFVDSHPKAIDITTTDSFYEDRVMIPEGLILKDDKIMICDTCHTRHTPTEWGQYMIMDFLQRDSICLKCHK